MIWILIILSLVCSFAKSSSSGCASTDEFKFSNGSCLDSCPSPYISREDDGGDKFCDPPCPDPEQQYFNVYTDRCLVYCDHGEVLVDGDITYCDQLPQENIPNGCPFSHDYLYSNGSCMATCPPPYKAERNEGNYHCSEPDCVIQTSPDGSRTTNCKDLSGHCASGYFLFDDSSCNQICPAGFSARKNAICKFPCGSNLALYPNGRCLDSCIAGYILRMEGNFMICDKDITPAKESGFYSATVEIYLRYNIPFKDFNAEGYLAKFINMLANLLDVSSSDIRITSLKEGSTMIQSEVTVKSKSPKSSRSKAAAMNQKLTEAIGSNSLNLEGIGVLNHNFNVVTPERGQSGSGDDNSHKKAPYALAVGLGVGVIVLLVICKYQKKRSFFKVKKQTENEVKANIEVETPGTAEKIKKDEEISFVVLQNSVSRETGSLSPLPQRISPQINAEKKNDQEVFSFVVLNNEVSRETINISILPQRMQSSDTEILKVIRGGLEDNKASPNLKSARQKRTEEIGLCQEDEEKDGIEGKLGEIEEAQEGALSIGDILQNLGDEEN